MDGFLADSWRSTMVVERTRSWRGNVLELSTPLRNCPYRRNVLGFVLAIRRSVSRQINDIAKL